MTEPMVILAIGLAILGEWKQTPIFRLASAPIFLAIGIQSGNELVLVSMLGISLVQAVRTFIER